MDRQTALSRARALMAGQAGPFGVLPLERMVARDLDLFVAIRAAGASWRAISGLMAEAGAARSDGAALSPGQWSAMISRALRRRAARAMPSAASGSATSHPSGSREQGSAKVEFLPTDAETDEPTANAAPGMPTDADSDRGETQSPAGSLPSAKPSDIRARMSRARQLRER